MDYRNKTVPELKSIAKVMGLHRYSKLRKADLIALLAAPILGASVSDMPAPVLQPIVNIEEQPKSKIQWLINRVSEQPKQTFNAIKSGITNLITTYIRPDHKI